MGRSKKALKGAEEAEAVGEQEIAEAPPTKSKKKEKKEADRKDEEQPSLKKRRKRKKEEGAQEAEGTEEEGAQKEERAQEEEEEPPAKVAKRKTDPAKANAPLLVFAHGAGAPSSHEWMIRWKKLLAEATGAVEVVTFDYPYCADGKKRAPPKAEKLVPSHKAEVEKAVSRHPGHPLVLVGKSMGSRVSCMVAGLDDVEVAAVVCLGYPLKVAHQNILRDQPLVELKAPVLFVQGRKDAMCPLGELHSVRRRMTVESEVHVVEDGDHSFKITRKKHMSQDASDRKAVDQIRAFLTKTLTNTS